MDINNKRKYQSQDNEDDLIILNQNLENSDSKRVQYLSYTDRYFKRYYKLDVKYKGNDHLILMHSNRVAVCTIAPSHPILDKSKYKVERIEFIQNVNEEMSGKHKHNAKNVNVDQPICKVYCKNLIKENNELDEVYFLICSCLNAKLIEINERLLEQPDLLQEKPFTEGYISILMPKLDNITQQINELIDQSTYLEKKHLKNV
jgi:hypothetical protein